MNLVRTIRSDNMTKQVLVSICGRQFDLEENEPIELVTTGEYYLKNGKHYIFYEEQMSEDDDITKNVLKISDGIVELKKRGVSEHTMVFEIGKKNHSNYHTPMGMLLMGVHTKALTVTEKEDGMELWIQYQLEVQGEHVSKCEITIKIQEKDV